MAVELHYGMDHDHYDWSPLDQHRGILRWPNSARVAVCVIVTLEHMEWSPPSGTYQNPVLSGGYGASPFPDVTRWSHREYGHRVGIFRLLDLLYQHGLKPTVAMDVLTAQNYPFLVRHCQNLGCEIIGHGMSVSRIITSNMSEPEEWQYIEASVKGLTEATGASPRGWLGPEYGESVNTPRLLEKAGIQYVCDWTNDEQPFPMKTPEGKLLALPVMLPLDDVNALWDRRVTIGRYVEMWKESFDTVWREGEANGRLMVINLRPWLTGQPFRVRYLDRGLEYMMGHQGVWAATGSEIADWYRQNPPGPSG
ncbi:MAG TPA: polysaccharide deacetylase family protein [Dehalococcoidia bacterium]|nr:polysaccharide deacetylase family protein [Dehalococcoidia bacterium]